MRIIATTTAVLVCGFVASALGHTDTYKFDTNHTQIQFKATHLVVSKVSGSFDKFEGTINLDPHNITGSSVEVSIETASINTQQAKRDGHVKSSDFLDVENNPAITFKSSGIKKKGDGHVATGTLTIRGVAKEVEITFDVQGPITDHMGRELIVVSLKFEINRHDFGVSWSKKLDSGGLVVGDKVKIDINVVAAKQG